MAERSHETFTGSAMEFGIQLLPLEVAKVRDLAQAVEGLGYDSLFITDHVFYEHTGGQTELQPAFEALLLDAMVVEATRRIRIGNLVLNNLFRHPIKTAQALVTLDHMSGGRMIAGMGTGWTASEFRMSGFALPEIAVRMEMLDEALTCIGSLWTEDSTTFEGKYYQLREAVLWPKPIQKPRIPILLGGGGRPIMRLAAKHANIVNIAWELGKAHRFAGRHLSDFNEESYRQRVVYLREQVARHGREEGEVRISNVLATVVVTDSEAATQKTIETVSRATGFTVEQTLRSPMALIGTVDKCVAELRRRATDWGVTNFLFATRSEKTIRMLAEKVLPQVIGG